MHVVVGCDRVPPCETVSWEGGRALPADKAADLYAGACHDWGRRRLAGFAAAGRAAELLEPVVSGADVLGTPLFAGWRALPLPDDAPARLAHLLHLARELRGGLHGLARTGLRARSAGGDARRTGSGGPVGAGVATARFLARCSRCASRAGASSGSGSARPAGASAAPRQGTARRAARAGRTGPAGSLRWRRRSPRREAAARSEPGSPRPVSWRPEPYTEPPAAVAERRARAERLTDELVAPAFAALTAEQADELIELLGRARGG